jgi:hypothetical protein
VNDESVTVLRLAAEELAVWPSIDSRRSDISSPVRSSIQQIGCWREASALALAERFPTRGIEAKGEFERGASAPLSRVSRFHRMELGKRAD